ncbi:MAG: zinc ribbon domain-containing protein [Capsulimonadaceae bacterium]|nr:zinc ribbon domain-containing protein [Capsulimonadaceae bacterium]
MKRTCGNCGAEVSGTEQVCANCGKTVEGVWPPDFVVELRPPTRLFSGRAWSDRVLGAMISVLLFFALPLLGIAVIYLAGKQLDDRWPYIAKGLWGAFQVLIALTALGILGAFAVCFGPRGVY